MDNTLHQRGRLKCLKTMSIKQQCTDAYLEQEMLGLLGRGNPIAKLLQDVHNLSFLATAALEDW